MRLKAELAEYANELGFDALRISKPILPQASISRHQHWLNAGYHTTMRYLARNPAKRYDAHSLLPECKSVVVLAHSYVSPEQSTRPPLKIARYAWGADYHDVIGEKLEALAAWLKEHVPDLRWKATVDTSPLAEKAFAAQAGIGWQGKNTLVVDKRLGSFFFIGCLLLNIELPSDALLENRCGDCQRCIDACPTGALIKPWVLDAELCISYQTTSRKGGPAADIDLAGWHYGCDDCQLACPHNDMPVCTREPRFVFSSERCTGDLNEQ